MRISATKALEIVGMVGITLFYPLQDWKLFTTRDPAGLSLPAFVSVGIGCAAFAYVSWRNRLWGMLVANAVGAGFTVAIIAGILLWS